MKLKLSIVLFVLVALFYPTVGTWAGEERRIGPVQERADARIRRVENGLIPLDQNRQPGQPAITKPVTAVAVLALVQRKELDLDEDVIYPEMAADGLWTTPTKGMVLPHR